MQKLFIYGTLAPGRPNEHILKDIEGTWQKASVKGILKQEGWGANMGYPGIILNDEANEVEGFIFSSNQLDKKFDILDEFEGNEYQRVRTKAKLENGEVIEAFVYSLKKEN